MRIICRDNVLARDTRRKVHQLGAEVTLVHGSDLPVESLDKVWMINREGVIRDQDESTWGSHVHPHINLGVGMESPPVMPLEDLKVRVITMAASGVMVLMIGGLGI